MDGLFTPDTHSHPEQVFLRSLMENKERSEDLQGLKTLIDEQKEKNPDTLYLDGGDFSMGTLIQTVYETEAAELRMLGLSWM